MDNHYDVVVIGGGSAGMAGAIEAKKNGAERVLIIERDKELGGILPQCIHNGFGSVIFKKDYPGPLYANKFSDQVESLEIDVLFDAMVIDITHSKRVYVTSCDNGYTELTCKSIILAMGCRERTRAQIRLPGTRPAGVFTAGMVQRFVNIEGYMPGNKFVILGSGDIGMIMARRLTLEGASVERVLEIMPFLTGLRRNYVQCLEDFNIKLSLEHTVNKIIGNKRLEAVETIGVDESLNPVRGTEEILECDSLLLSVGLIPENELTKKAGIYIDPVTGGPYVNQRMETSNDGVFACGNVVFIHDLVDYVTLAGYIAGKNAALYAIGKHKKSINRLRLLSGENVHSVVPQYLDLDFISDEDIRIFLRVNSIIEKKVRIELLDEKNIISTFRENYVRPAEMIVLKIRGMNILKNISNDTEKLYINVIEESS